jgi:hypothetical protein
VPEQLKPGTIIHIVENAGHPVLAAIVGITEERYQVVPITMDGQQITRVVPMTSSVEINWAQEVGDEVDLEELDVYVRASLKPYGDKALAEWQIIVEGWTARVDG